MAASKPFSKHIIGALTPEMLDAMLQDSFFLPAEVLEAADMVGWKIPPINVVDNQEFWDNFDLLSDNANHIAMQPSYEILRAAKRIGVSVRKFEKEGSIKKVYILCKLWMD